MKRMIIRLLFFLLLFILFSLPVWSERVYSIVPSLNVRDLPSAQAKKITRLRHGRWVEVLEKTKDWLKVRLPDGKQGFVSKKLTTAYHIKVLKDERQLILFSDKLRLFAYPIGLGFNPRRDKIKLGDGCTPEGRFYICQVIKAPKPFETYGPVSLRISYPNIEDARRGLAKKLITKAQYLSIVKAVHQGKMPPQRTVLGGSIKIHGGDPGASGDWTLGCMAMNNHDIRELFALIPRGLVMVDVYRNIDREKRLNADGAVNRIVLEECGKLLKKGCLYTRNAVGIIPMSYPMGDIPASEGVCTDVVIRALRGVNIDLQALLYEDITVNPRRYPNISGPNPNIDHRRSRNLKRFFDANAVVLTTEPPVRKPDQWLPGDIVIMDTGIRNGTVYDHIGIVSSRKGAGGVPLVVNLWSVGYRLNEMELLDGDYPGLVAHYRLHHPLYY